MIGGMPFRARTLCCARQTMPLRSVKVLAQQSSRRYHCTVPSCGGCTAVPMRPTERDIRAVQEKQLRHRAPIARVGHRCRHGFPKAFVFDVAATWRNKGTVHHGLCRLSCPLLVAAVDEWENEHGGVEHFSSALRADPSLRNAFAETHRATAALRRRVMAEDDPGALREAETHPNAAMQRTLNIGLAGVDGEKDKNLYNVKCLHAVLADYLCRAPVPAAQGSVRGRDGLQSGAQDGGEGRFAAAEPSARKPDLELGHRVMSGLAERGLWRGEPRDCARYCDPDSGEFGPLPRKNKQKLWRTRQRRLEEKRRRRTE